MTYLQAILLGLVQGLTEFLPVSSSGHLVLGEKILGLTGDTDVLFEVLVHFGTLLAIVVVFRRRLLALVAALGPGGDPAERRMIAALVVGTVPAAVAGVTLQDFFTGLFASVAVVSVALLVTGGILRLARERPDADDRTTLGRAAVVGLAQALAITPGISRSGTTIAVGLRLGLSQARAAEFSFLLAVPAILGATVLEVKDVFASGAPPSLGPYLVGMATAAISGYAALRWLLGLLRRGRFHHFSWYCWAVGVMGLLGALAGG